jgi:cobalt/nickel transport system ATP-binding protein
VDSNNSALIRLTNITFAYPGGEPVLKDLNFTLSQADRIGLVGPNGSGKSTLLQVMEGLLRPDSGTVEIFGQVRKTEKDYYPVRERVGFLFQNPDDQLFCPTVAEDVAFGPLNLGKSRDEAMEIVRETLDMLGLAGFENRVTHKLSGGEKRLVSLATVLAMKPEILLLDEPISGLDEATAQKITRILANLPQPRIVVAHDREFFQKVTNSLRYMVGGKVEQVEC